ncbi:MAG: CotH kinase protein [Pseudomonadota bacterium]
MKFSSAKSESRPNFTSLILFGSALVFSQWVLASPSHLCQEALKHPTKQNTIKIDRSVIFSSNLDHAGAIQFTMTGDFAKAKRLSGGGNWTGEKRPYDQFGVAVELDNVGLKKNSIDALTGKVKIRGMSSADAAKFPKLKLKLSKKQETESTLFSGIKGLRINTSGFYNTPEAPFREALGYEIAEILGLPTPHIQRAEINYQQQFANGNIKSLKEKQALLIENDKPLFERLRVKDVSSEFLEGKVELDLEKTALLFAFDTLIMNDDINIRVRSEPKNQTEKYRPLFNTSILLGRNATKGVPLVYDLDKSELVSLSRYPEKKPSRFFGREMNGLEIGMIKHLIVMRQRFSAEEVDKALTQIIENIPKITKLIADREQNLLIDSKGASRARELVSYFETAATTLQTIDVTLQATNIYREPLPNEEGSLYYSELFPNEKPMRPGTPIKVLEKTPDEKFLKVLILDSRDEIQNEASLQDNSTYHDFLGYISADTPIGRRLTEQELGHINDFDMVEFY